MTVSRRQVLGIGGVLLAGLRLPGSAAARDPVEIRMLGNADGSQVWFEPIGLHVQPGQTVRWVNLDQGNSHTTTAYHLQNFGRPIRIPEDARSWHSDYLLPNETFSITLTVEGIYDYFCVPHEHAGMVGRIVVGRPRQAPASNMTLGQADSIPAVAQQAFPSVEAIMRQGVVHHSG